MSLEFSPSDPLFQLAVVLVSGIIGGELVGRVGLPKVTGWIATGILLRGLAPVHSAFTGLTADAIAGFNPFMSFVLGYIAFTVGAALHFASLRNAGKRLGLLLTCEALITTTVVVVAMYFPGRWLAPGRLSLEACLVLGAIAVAGAPGTTVLVVREARARGILTRTLVAAVALIDMVAVAVFTFITAFIANGNGGMEPSQSAWVHSLLVVAHEFGMALVVGGGSALMSLALTRTLVGPAFLGPMMVAAILGAWGGAIGVGTSGILACTIAGIVVTNLRHDTVRSTEAYLQSIGGVLFAAFYTMAGLKIDFALVMNAVGLVVLYFIARFLGKYVGAYAAMSLAGAPRKVRHFLGLSLLPHGGVAVGLVLIVQSKSQLQGISDIVTTVGLAALAVNQLLGPSAARYALKKSGESEKDAPRLLDFLDEHHISVNVSGDSKEDVIRLLATQLYATKIPPSLPEDDFIAAVLKRENEESTCLSEGLMIPHAEVPEGEAMTGMLGISSQGLQLGAPDGQPIHAVLLLATPKEEHQRHLEVLAAVANFIVRDVNLREQLYHAWSAAHAYDVLHADEAEDINYFLEDALVHSGISAEPDAGRQP